VPLTEELATFTEEFHAQPFSQEAPFLAQKHLSLALKVHRKTSIA